MKGKTLCLDPAVRTGYAIYKDDELQQAGYACFRKYSKCVFEERMNIYANWLKTLLKTEHISHLVIELPLPHMRHIKAAKILYTISGVILGVAFCEGVPVTGYYPKDIKRWATGKVYAQKEDMLQAWERNYGPLPEGINDDALDAMWIGEYHKAQEV